MSTLYTLEDKIAFTLKVIDSCETVEHLNGASNMLHNLSAIHKHEEHRLKPVRVALVDKYEDLYLDILQSQHENRQDYEQ